jgi:glucose-6-phosphate isomerase
MLIALYERAVGLYAELIDINAYHQPGVEAGKKAAKAVLDLQSKVVTQLKSANRPHSAADVADAIGLPDEVETVYKILEHLAVTGGRGIAMGAGDSPKTILFHAT